MQELYNQIQATTNPLENLFTIAIYIDLIHLKTKTELKSSEDKMRY